MLRRISQFIAWLGFKGIPTISPILNTPHTDSQAHEAVKRTRAAFSAQTQHLKAKAMQPHSFDCEDPVTCTKPECWKFVADKIVSGPYVVLDSKGKVRVKRRHIRLLEAD